MDSDNNQKERAVTSPYYEGRDVFSGRFVLVKVLDGNPSAWLARDGDEGVEIQLHFLPGEFVRNEESQPALSELRSGVEAATALNHKRMVRILGFHEGQGEVAVALEHVDGETLSDRIQAQSEQVPIEAKDWMGDVVDALTYAHSDWGVVHRDVKPDTVWLERKGGRAKLAPPGLGRVLSAGSTEIDTKDRPWMSPQKLAGDGPQVSDDIYSLGATLAYALTGKPPRDGRVDTAGREDVFSPGLVHLLDRSLSEDPAQRPASALEFRKDLLVAIAEKIPGGKKPPVLAARIPEMDLDEPAKTDKIVRPTKEVSKKSSEPKMTRALDEQILEPPLISAKDEFREDLPPVRKSGRGKKVLLIALLLVVGYFLVNHFGVFDDPKKSPSQADPAELSRRETSKASLIPSQKPGAPTTPAMPDAETGDGVQDEEPAPRLQTAATANGRIRPGEGKIMDWNGYQVPFRWIPAGKGRLGSKPGEPGRQDREEAEREVEFAKGFWMSEHEVTREEWAAVMSAGENLPDTGLPIVGISWVQIAAKDGFLQKLNATVAGEGEAYQLPSRNEWEYACRAGSDTAYHHGKKLTERQARIYQKGKRGPSVIESYEPNAWGLYEMCGNVWEWCADDVEIPQVGKGLRCFIGGGWASKAELCRAASWDYNFPGHQSSQVGFRVIMKEKLD